jgi:hypothetical protein
MSNPLTKHDALLKEHRFRLVRSAKHRVYQDPVGRVYVTASTPSDYRAAHNMLCSLKRVIANPPMPMVLAISEFEREQAAQHIQGQQRSSAGMSGAGKHKSSRGTGFIYEDRNLPLTPEQEAARREEKRRRDAREAEKRERKLQHKAELQAARAAREAEERRLEEFVEGIIQQLQPIMYERIEFFYRGVNYSRRTKWFTNKLSCRLACFSPTRDARKWMTKCVNDAREGGAKTLDQIDKAMSREVRFWHDCVYVYLPKSATRFQNIIVSLVHKSVKKKNDVYIVDSDVFLERIRRRADDISDQRDETFYIHRLLHSFADALMTELVRAQELAEIEELPQVAEVAVAA